MRRVLRVIEYIGNEAFIENQLKESIHGVKKVRSKDGKIEGEIRVATIGVYPDILDNLKDEVKAL
jgi:hypothetical protein